MKILALETANFSGSLALGDAKGKVVSSFVKNPHDLSAKLVPEIQKLLRELSLKIQDLDLLVCTTGPGSFTGVRLGLATIRGLHLATNVPMMGINSFQWVLESLPQDFHPDIPIFVALDARRSDLFGQLFAPNRSALKPPQSLPFDQIDSYLGGVAWVVGNGADQVLKHTHLKDVRPYQNTNLGTSYRVPGAQDLLALADRLYTPDIDISKFPCEPFYLRPADIGQAKKPLLPLSVVPLEDALLASAARVHQACFPRGWQVDDFRPLLANPGGFGFALLDQGTQKCAGFLIARTAADECEILSIAVQPKLRRKGWGSALMQAALTYLQAHPIKKVFLEVEKTNIPAMNLYKKCGFSYLSERPKYYPSEASLAQDAVLLQLNLVSSKK